MTTSVDQNPKRRVPPPAGRQRVSHRSSGVPVVLMSGHAGVNAHGSRPTKNINVFIQWCCFIVLNTPASILS